MKKNYLKFSSFYLALASFLLVGTGYATEIKGEQNSVVEVYATQFPMYKPLNDYGSFVIRMDKKTHVTEQDFLAQATTFFGLNETNSFRLINSYTDFLGKKHNTYQHYVGAYAVEGQMFIVHLDTQGRVTSVNGTIINIENKKSIYSLRSNVNRKPAITQTKALDIAFQANQVKEDKATTYPVETLFVRSATEEGLFVLAHRVRVEDFSNGKMLSKHVFIGVEKGEIVNEFSLLAHANEIGSGDGFYRPNLPLGVSFTNGKYQLEDKERKLRTLDGTKIEDEWDIYWRGGEVYESDTPTFAPSPSNDVHWGLSKTYDYYRDVHQRDSYDNLGGEITAYYNPIIMDGDDSGFPNNAVALTDPINVLVFGRGSGSYNPLTAIDITGHEFTHLVIESNGRGGLLYQGESGALNEGFADIFGASIAFHTLDDASWQIGKGVLKNGEVDFMRNMQNPKEGRRNSRQPNTYKGEFWARTGFGDWDNGGVHINSGVLNYWYYLLTEGGSGMTDPIYNSVNEIVTPAKEYVVSGIGLQRAEKLAYHTLITQLGRSSQFVDAVEGALSAAEDLFGLDSEEYFAVYDAWYAVGLIENPRENMGVEDFELTEEVFSIYPNPVSDAVLTVLIKDEKGSVSIYNMMGQKVTRDFAVERGENKIDLPQLNTGTYLVVYESKERKIREKIIVR